MYLRTPKRYTRKGQRRSLPPFRRLFLWLVLLVLIVAGVGLYYNLDLLRPLVDDAVNSLESARATAVAPTATPLPDASTTIARADEAWERGAITEAVRLYRSILPAVPNRVEVFDRVTVGLITDGQFEAALDSGERAVNADPFSSDAWTVYAWALDWNGQPEEAIVYGLHALELNPDNYRTMAVLSEAYLSAGQVERAREAADNALELNPQGWEGFRARALVTREGDFNFTAAREDFATAYSLAPNMSLLAVDLAITEGAYLGNPNTAIAILQEVVDLSPENTTALYWLGVFYFRDLGDPNQATRYLSTCVDVNPESVLCHYYLGRVQYADGLLVDASTNLDRAIELGSTDPRHYYWAGDVRISLGDCAGAIPLLQRGYELAREREQETLYADFEASLRTCGAVSLSPAAEATAAPGG